MDCGRPRQVSELWAALVRTTGLSNLPPWRACERTGQHLGRGEVTRGTRAGASRASTTVLARRFRADPHEVGRIEGLGILGSWSRRRPAGFFGVGRACRPGPADRGQRRTRAGGCRAGELVDQGHGETKRAMKYIETDRPRQNPRYYIRAFEITAISGLGRFGGRGVASPATSSTIIMSSTWASVVPAGTVPKDYPRHFDGLSARPGAPVSRRPPRNRAHRGPRA